MSTKEIPGPFDGLERALPDEPVFTLRAKDPLAIQLVREWVFQRRQAIVHGDLPDEKRELELIQAREAEMIAEAMEDWRTGHQEVVAKKVDTYSGNTMGADELAAKHRFDTIKHVAERLNNSVSEVTDAAMTLETLDEGYAATAATLLSAAEDIKQIAYEVQPKRASYAHRA